MNLAVDCHAGILVVRLDHPPVNALSVRDGLVARLSREVAAALADPAIGAIVLAGTGRLFCGGADLADFDGDPAALDAIRALMTLVETAPKPIVCALHGVALGAGLELAIAAHYRIAAPDTRLGLPEVTLGILPGAGGTQRLPRLVGPDRALAMMLDGKPIDAATAAGWGLIDLAVDGDPVVGALAFLAARPGLPPRPTGARAIEGDAAAAIAQARAAPRRPTTSRAADHIIACVEAAATQPLAAGLAIEARLFDELMASDAARALRHAFLGERMAARIPGLPADTATRSIDTVGIVGGGLMGTGIALAMLNAGLRVMMIEPRADALDKARTTITKTLLRDVEKGRLDRDRAEARLAAFACGPAPAALAAADLVIEAVFEDMAVKRAVFAELDAVAAPHAILASNTSTLDLDAIAGFTRRPEQVIGLHFFSPANIMRLVEIVRGKATAPDVLASAMAFARRIGKVGVVAGVCDGFIGNRMFEEYLRQAWFLLEEGALPARLDGVLEAWGMAMGPCRTMDLAGQDIGWSIRKRRAIEQPDRPYSRVPDLICERGWFGQKSGRGFYRYPDGRTAERDPEVDALIEAHSAELGLERRAIADEEIISRCTLALANEGARIIGEGIAYRPVDVDVVYLNGYGFPAYRGGPMFEADRLGLPAVLDRISEFARGRHGWAWAPAPLLVDLAGSGGRLADLNR